MIKTLCTFIAACACIGNSLLADDRVVRENVSGDAARTKWDYVEAIRCYSKALQKTHLIHMPYRLARSCTTRTGEFDKALFDSTRAIQLDPEYAPAYFARGIAFRRRDDLNKAISDLSEAIRLAPESGDYISMRGDLYAERGSLKKAMTDYDRAVELDPEVAVNFCCRGDLRARVGDYAGAAADYLQSQKIDPVLSAPYISYAWLLASCPDNKIQNPAAAVEYCQNRIGSKSKARGCLDCLRRSARSCRPNLMRPSNGRSAI